MFLGSFVVLGVSFHILLSSSKLLPKCRFLSGGLILKIGLGSFGAGGYFNSGLVVLTVELSDTPFLVFVSCGFWV